MKQISKLCRGLLCGALSFSLGVTPQLFAAETVRARAEYLHDCGRQLRAESDTSLRNVLLELPRNEAERLQLLRDYGLILSAQFEGAFQQTLRDWGIIPGSPDIYDRIRYLLKERREELPTIVSQTLAHLRDFKVPERSIESTRAHQRRVNDFEAALASTPSGAETLQTLTDFVQQGLRRFVDREAIEKTIARTGVGTWIGSSVVMAGLSFFYFAEIPDPHYLAGSIAIDTTILFTSGVVAALVGIAPGLLVGAIRDRPLNRAMREIQTFPSILPLTADAAITHPWAPAPRTLPEIAQVGIKELTPVDLAYVGDVELLAIADLYDRVFFARQQLPPNDFLREAAQHLLESPDVMRSRLEFSSALKQHNEIFGNLVFEREANAERLSAKIKSTIPELESLRKQLYLTPVEAATEAEFLGLELTLVRLEFLTHSLERHKSDPRDNDELFYGRLTPIAEQLRDLAAHVPTQNEDWRIPANRVLDLLKQIDSYALERSRP